MNDLMSVEINELASALSKAQATIENVSKDKQAYGYKYADLASCLHIVKKPLADNGLSISQLISQDGDKHILITLLLHSSGQWLKSTFVIENVVMKQCNSLQQLGAGISYARRYTFSAIIGLAQEDDDAQSITPKKENSDAEKSAATLIALCHAKSVDPKKFAEHFKFTGKDLDKVNDAISNFPAKLEEYRAHIQ